MQRQAPAPRAASLKERRAGVRSSVRSGACLSPPGQTHLHGTHACCSNSDHPGRQRVSVCYQCSISDLSMPCQCAGRPLLGSRCPRASTSLGRARGSSSSLVLQGAPECPSGQGWDGSEAAGAAVSVLHSASCQVRGHGHPQASWHVSGARLPHARCHLHGIAATSRQGAAPPWARTRRASQRGHGDMGELPRAPRRL